MRRVIGYVVLEWNQASGLPMIKDEEIFASYELAAALADDLATEAEAVGRHERYMVAQVLTWPE